MWGREEEWREMYIWSVNIHWCISELPIGYCNRCRAQKNHGKISCDWLQVRESSTQDTSIDKRCLSDCHNLFVGLETFDVMSKGTHHRSTTYRLCVSNKKVLSKMCNQLPDACTAPSMCHMSFLMFNLGPHLCTSNCRCWEL